MNESKKFIVIDNNQKEIEMEILFTYENEENHKQYVFYFNPTDEEQAPFVSRYDAEGNLFPVEDDAEFEMLDNVFASYYDDNGNDNEDGCGCGHHHDHEGCGCDDDNCSCEDDNCECAEEECDCCKKEDKPNN